MMRIESVSSQPDRAGRYTVKLSDGTVMRLYRQTIQDFMLFSGTELSEETMEDLRTAAGAMSAKMRAVRIVSMSSLSKRDLEQRLIQKGEDPNQAKDAVKWMSDLDLLDDRKTAQQIVNRCIGKGYGLARAKQALFEKRIPKEFWDEALEDYPDQQEHIVSYLQAHLSDSYQDRDLRKVIDALIRRGHSYHEIRKGLQKIEASLEEEYG